MNQNVHFILYVNNQEKSSSFYSNLLKINPILHVPGMTEFQLNTYCKLGIMPASGIKKIIGHATKNPELGIGIPSCELYIHVDSPAEYLISALNAGAKLISEAQMRDWGDEVAYCSDMDGHVLAFARKSI